MNTLVINLTRFGDLLQTQPVLSGLKERGDKVGLVCLDNFAQAAGLLRDVDFVVGLPGAKFLAALDAGWQQGLSRVWEWQYEGVRPFEPESVVNLTSTLSGRLLGRISAVVPTVGYGLDPFGFATTTTPWAGFMQASSRNRGNSPFNLVDQFRQVAGLGPAAGRFRLAEPDSDALANVQEILSQDAPAEAVGFVGFQLGASDDVRRWPIEFFAQVGRRLWDDFGICPVLTGAPGEKHLAERYAAVADTPFVNCVGRTSLKELAALMTELRMLVTNDTGTMHLAAGMGTPICSIFLATAQPWDTGPYLPGSLSVEADMPCHPCDFRHKCTIGYACRRNISPSALYHYIWNYLQTGHWDEAKPPSGLRAWVAACDDDGFMNLESISEHEESDRTAWVRMQRHFYRQFLDGRDVTPMGNSPVLTPEVAEKASKTLESVSGLLFLLGKQAQTLGQAPIPSLKSKFLGNFERVGGVWNQSGLFTVLGDLWRNQSHEVGADFDRLPALFERYGQLAAAWKASIR